MFQFLKKPLALTQKSVTVTPMKVSSLSVSPTYNNPLPSNPVHLASVLTGKTVRYENKNHKSTVTIDGQRTFKITAIEDVSVSKTTGNQYVTAKVQDIDDGGKEKYRSLIVDGISIVV